MKPSGLVYLHLAIKGECPISRFFHTLDSSEIKPLRAEHLAGNLCNRSLLVVKV